MGLFRNAFRALFAIAILAQFAAPVLAANATALNLYCPSHLSQAGEDSHAGHVADHADHSNHTGHVGNQPEPNDTDRAARLFDPSCCSVHLAGVMPAVSEPAGGLILKIHAAFADDAAFAAPVTIDPPPRAIL